ncbi:S8 family serine peptidase [Solihabitans fulvus]|uniref:S8 family serine peptidase n=1 Tax=Solihabitans fulvus TaxID=1892852 RepID=UPI001CB7668D
MAGNQSEQGNPATYPASFPGVVSVTGIDESNQFWPQSESGPQTTLAAPAGRIFSANDQGRYLRGDGTSYAAPYVAAAAALVWSQHPDLTANQVTRQLTTTADHKGTTPRDDQYGYGILNPLRALTTAPNHDTTSPLAEDSHTSTPPPDSSPLLAIVGAGVGAVVVIGVAAVLYWRRRHRAATAAAVPAKQHTAHRTTGTRPTARRR